MDANMRPPNYRGGVSRRRAHVERGHPVTVHSRKKKRKSRVGALDFILGMLGAIFLFGGLVFAILAWREKAPYVKAKAEYEKFRTEAADPLPDNNPYAGDDAEGPAPEAVETYGEELSVRGMDWVKMRYINQDIVAWITVPGTQIDYPVCQGADNEYYLSHNAYRDSNALGAIFADSQCSFTSGHPILYGHNMEEGQMFGELSFYESEAFWRSHPYVYIYTPDGCERWAVFSAFQTNEKDALYQVGLEPGSEGYQGLIDRLLGERYYDTGISPDGNARVMTLSTCADYGYEGDRFTVHLVRQDAGSPDGAAE